MIKNDRSRIMELPNELLFLILRHMKIDEVLKMCDVIKRFRVLSEHYLRVSFREHNKIIFDFTVSDSKVSRGRK